MTIVRPFAIQLGPLELTGFGLAVLLAFVIAQIVSQRELARRGHDPEPIGDLIFAAVIGGLAGAKLYYVILSRDITTLWSRGGFVFWGGLIGGTIAVLLVARAKRLGIARIADVGGIAVAAAYAVGRTGCWSVGDDYGRPWNSTSPLAVAFPDGAPPTRAGIMERVFGTPLPAGATPDTLLAVYPTQLVEITLAIGMFLILWRLRDHEHAEGWLFGVYMVLAGVERFLVEFLRAKDDRFFWGLTTAQLLAVLFVIAGLVVMRWRSQVTPGRPGIHSGGTAARRSVAVN